jgi:hypothetical protein
MIKKNVYWYSYKVPFILVRLKLRLIFLDRFSKNPQISNFIKSIQREPSCFTRTNRRTDMTKLIVVFRNFANAPKNTIKVYYFLERKCVCGSKESQRRNPRLFSELQNTIMEKNNNPIRGSQSNSLNSERVVWDANEAGQPPYWENDLTTQFIIRVFKVSVLPAAIV